VFGGIAVATVVGVPLGTLAGRLLGWRAAFAGVVILGGLALSALMAFVPPVASRASGGIAAQARFALARPVLAMLAFGLVVIGGEFTAFTYLTPYLERVTGVPAGLVSVFLLAYGAAAAAGTFGGGQLADRSPAAAISAATVILAAALGVLLAAGQHPAAVLVALVAWGLAGFGLLPAFQVRVIGLAGRGGDLAATLGASAVNAGIAAGAAAGGWLVAAHGIRGAVAGALACCAVMIPAGAATALLKAPGAAREATAPPAAPARGRRAS
jgi:DHA1 family inner membrane transport protein